VRLLWGVRAGNQSGASSRGRSLPSSLAKCAIIPKRRQRGVSPAPWMTANAYGLRPYRLKIEIHDEQGDRHRAYDDQVDKGPSEPDR